MSPDPRPDAEQVIAQWLHDGYAAYPNNEIAEACENPGHVENHQDGPEWFCPDCGSGWWATDGTGPMCEINYVVAGVARRALAALAPERTTTPDSMTDAQPVTDPGASS